MRVNVYAEEITDRCEVLKASTPEGDFIGIRFNLELPATIATGAGQTIHKGPYVPTPGGRDRSACVTFWARTKPELLKLLDKATFEVANTPL